MARFERIRGAYDATGPLLYRDGSIDEGTQSLIHMGSVWAGGGAAFADEAQVLDLTYAAQHAVVSGNLPFAGGGCVFEQAVDDYVELPAPFMLDATRSHFLMAWWLRMDVDGQSGANNAPLSARTTGGQWHYVMTPTVNGSGVVTNLEWYQGGQTTLLLDRLYRLFDDKPHQLAVETIIESATFYQRFYLDGVMVYQTPSRAYTAPDAPAPGDRARVGVSVIHPRAFGGRFYRARYDDLTRTARDATAILMDDIAITRGLFA